MNALLDLSKRHAEQMDVLRQVIAIDRNIAHQQEIDARIIGT